MFIKKKEKEEGVNEEKERKKKYNKLLGSYKWIMDERKEVYWFLCFEM